MLSIEDMYERIGDYIGERNYSAGLRCCERVLKLKPDDFIVLNQKAQIYKALSKYDDALELLDKLADKTNYEIELAEVYQNKAKIYFEKEEYKNEIDCYNEILKLNPELDTDIFYETYQSIAESYRKLKNYDNAIDYLNNAIEFSKKYDYYFTHILIEIVRIHIQQKEYEKALQVLSEAKKIKNNDDEDSLEIYEFSGDALLELGKYNEAISDYNKVKKYLFDSNDGLIKLKQAQAFMRKGDIENAKKYLKSGISSVIDMETEFTKSLKNIRKEWDIDSKKNSEKFINDSSDDIKEEDLNNNEVKDKNTDKGYEIKDLIDKKIIEDMQNVCIKMSDVVDDEIENKLKAYNEFLLTED